MSYEIQVRRAAELDIAEAQVWYETQQSGLGRDFRTEISRVIDRITALLSFIKKCIGTFGTRWSADFLISFGIV